MVKSEKVIIVGKSGSGKDFLLRGLVSLGLKPGVKTTTRPPRKNEVDGVNYNFVSYQEFQNLLTNGKFISFQEFLVTPENDDPQTWFYGLTVDEFINSQVFIMTPGELSFLSDEQRRSCFVVFLDIGRSVREKRLHIREDKNDSIRRRLDSDDLDFSNFTDYDLRIYDPDFIADDVYSLMF